MSQAVVLKELKEKLRRKFWECKDADENDWRKRLFEFEIESLNKRIQFLQEISDTANMQVVTTA
jgi:hypothetical protein